MTGPTGGKPAIVQVSGKWRTLYCVESPEVLFMEFIGHVAAGGESSVAIDPLFCEACQSGTMRLVAAASEDFAMGWLGGKVRDGRVELSRKLGEKESVHLTVVGTRRGFAGARFVESTEMEARRQAAKWS